MSKPINIQPSQANQLVQALKHEIELAKAAGSGTEESQQHYAKAELIKKILLSYQAQQKAKQESMANQSNVVGNMGTPPTANASTPLMGAGSPPARGFTPMRQSSPGAGPQPGSSNSPPLQQTNSGSSSNMSSNPGNNNNQPQLPASAITLENFNQVKQRLGEFERRMQLIMNQKKTGYSNPDQLSQLESQLTELKGKYSRYQKFAFYMKSELIKQGKIPSQPNQATNQGPGAPSLPIIQSQQSGLTPGQSMSSQGSGMTTGAVAPPNMNAVPSGQVGGGPAMSGVTGGSGPTSTATTAPTPAPGAAGLAATNASLESKGKSPSPDKLNLSGITKPSVPLMPISSTINVKPPNPITLKPNGGGIRPTLTGGYSTSMGQVLNQPSTKLPNYEIANNALMPDNNRVLLKRKLNELINTIGADEGDGKTVVDGDVEELMLDLADEFITSVTGFACRLAKHRKVDSIDVKDIQLHLEKNWNIRIPGYSIDEIKSVKRLGPSTSYLQKVQGVEIAKSVNDIN